MSYSSLFGIKENYTGEIICDFKNSWLFSPVVMGILPDKYIPEFLLQHHSALKRALYRT